jgi:hypothetical protein
MQGIALSSSGDTNLSWLTLLFGLHVVRNFYKIFPHCAKETEIYTGGHVEMCLGVSDSKNSELGLEDQLSVPKGMKRHTNLANVPWN